MKQRLRQRISTVGQWLEDRTGLAAMIRPALTHLAPRDARWWYVFGSATLAAFVMQIITGLALAMVYVPGGEEAYESIRYITEDAMFGSFVRGMHVWGASTMVAMVVLHMSQVFFHGTYKYPREMNWMSGVVLLFLTLGLGFTGQLLRWDANGVWSVVVAAEMAGRTPVVGRTVADFVLAGDTINGGTLSRFFILHAAILPALMVAGIALHLHLVLRHGISEMPKAGRPVEPATYRRSYEERLKRTGLPFWPHAAWRDALVALGVVLAVVGLAWYVGPPELGGPPDPSNLEANPHPDWYFLWYFAILAMLPPSLETVVILGAPVVAFLALLALPLVSNRGERAPSRRPWAVAALICGYLGFGVLTIKGAREPWSPNFAAGPLPASVVASDDPEVQRGAVLFHDRGCIYCHEIAGHGGQRGPDLSTAGRRMTEQQLILRIDNGGHNMPAFAGVIDRENLRGLVAFLKSRR